jgi:hypothetical protein
MSSLFPGRELRTEAARLECGELVTVRMHGALAQSRPPTAVGHANVPLRHWWDDWP